MNDEQTNDEQTLKHLIAARKLITPESHWISHRLAATGKQPSDFPGAIVWLEELSPTDARATAWCAVGALWKVSGSRGFARWVNQFAESHFGRCLMRTNDIFGHQAVLKQLDRLIAEVRAHIAVERLKQNAEAAKLFTDSLVVDIVRQNAKEIEEMDPKERCAN